MSEWRLIECDRCHAAAAPSLYYYPELRFRLVGWSHLRDPNPAVMGRDFCPACTAVIGDE